MPVLPFQLSGELGYILAHLARQCWPGALAFTFACGWPLLKGRLRSLDLGVEFGEAGIAMEDTRLGQVVPKFRVGRGFGQNSRSC